jgi:hypothetical protein
MQERRQGSITGVAFAFARPNQDPKQRRLENQKLRSTTHAEVIVVRWDGYDGGRWWLVLAGHDWGLLRTWHCRRADTRDAAPILLVPKRDPRARLNQVGTHRGSWTLGLRQISSHVSRLNYLVRNEGHVANSLVEGGWVPVTQVESRVPMEFVGSGVVLSTEQVSEFGRD